MVAAPPPFLLAAGLLFWGWYGEFMAAAAAMAIALEAPRYLRLRWGLSARDFERIADLCTVAFVSALAFQFLQSRHFPDSLIAALVWLPMLFFALLLGQRYSIAQRVPLSALFWSLRHRARGPTGERRVSQAMRLDYAYFCLCLLAASSANPRTPWFFAGLSVLGMYALWPAAPQRSTRRAWALALVAAVGLGFAAQAGLLRAQASLEEWVFDWLSHRWTSPADLYQSQTAIGDIGELKASDRIVLRVGAVRGSAPERLRTAAYNVYGGGTWTAPGQVFTPITANNQTWNLAPGRGAIVRLSAWLDHQRALLALPLGTFRLDSLDVSSVQHNPLGAVRIEEGPDMLLFEAQFDPRYSLDAAPDSVDLSLPSGARPTLQKVADEIGIPDRDPRAAAQAIAGFFDSRFEYSLALSGGNGMPRSLSQFLLTDRRGHCEYFATATVLLLRHAGVPARYATGYSVQEWSPLEHQYVVRERHAHAWALAWIDQRWQELDTTPAVWVAEEQRAASALQPVYDLLSLLNYRVALWQRARVDASGGATIMLWIAVMLAMYLAWRVWHRHRVRVPARPKADSVEARQISNPSIAALLRALTRLGYACPPSAPLLRWVRELPLADSEMRWLLEDTVRGYYRTRFDPLGAASEQEQLLLDRRVGTLLQRLAGAPAQRKGSGRIR
ncbi:MAG TPA: transglutaminase domain-containing protein [Burkholderiales bacterium]|nr:transglutaminase domain-containing protein [Burkholderiales bacterium]